MAVELADIHFVALVSIIACFHQARLAAKVGAVRRKHKIAPPATTGNEELERAIRAQTNCVEFFTPFIGVLWVAAVFFHQVPVAIIGLFYVISREKYVDNYIVETSARLPYFYHSLRCLKALLGLAVVGVIQFYVLHYAGIDIKHHIWKTIGSITPNKFT